jgi:NSS family neurotransmitter:Na+ symporter
MAEQQTQQWGSRWGVVLAVAGSAVGLGNYLRFPGLAAQYGGGAFMIPYFCALIFLALPVGWAEWAMARYGGRKGLHSAPGVMGVIGRSRFFRYFGALGVLISACIFMYYIFVEAWCLRYAWQYLAGGLDLGGDPAALAKGSGDFFVAATGSNADGALFRNLDVTLIFWVLVFALNAWLIYRGLQAGIEKFCSYALPTMAVLSIIVLIRVLTLGTPDPSLPEQSVINGLGFMWNPDFSKLANFDTWLAAAGQVFFTLSVGFGVILNYASYLRAQDDLVLSGLTAAATNEVSEVGFGGLITIPAAFVFLGTTFSLSTFGMGFNALPVVFEHMGAAGRWMGFAWFFLLFLAAVASSISMLQPLKAFFEEALRVTHRRATTLSLLLTSIGSLFVVWFTKDLMAMDTLDSWVGNFLVFVFATVMVLCFGWIFGIDRGMRQINQGALMRVPTWFGAIIKYVAPTYLLVVLAGFLVKEMPAKVSAVANSKVAMATMALVALTGLVLVLVLRRGERTWRREGLDLDDKQPLED